MTEILNGGGAYPAMIPPAMIRRKDGSYGGPLPQRTPNGLGEAVGQAVSAVPFMPGWFAVGAASSVSALVWGVAGVAAGHFGYPTIRNIFYAVGGVGLGLGMWSAYQHRNLPIPVAGSVDGVNPNGESLVALSNTRGPAFTNPVTGGLTVFDPTQTDAGRQPFVPQFQLY